MTERVTNDGLEVFEPTAEGILRWVKTTRPEPPRPAVLAHARQLAREGALPAAELEALVVAGYPELAPAPESDPVERAMREIREERPELVEAQPAIARSLTLMRTGTRRTGAQLMSGPS